MTTLAIIGSGIAGRSLLYALAKEKIFPSKVLLFHSEKMSPPCSFASTAIVAPRGVTTGHSELGNLLVEGFDVFRRHVAQDSPFGVEEITQTTGASSKLEQFKKRYPNGVHRENFYIAEERAFMVYPEVYLSWLLEEGKKVLPLTVINDFVTAVKEEQQKVFLTTKDQKTFEVDQVVFATGAHSRFWGQHSSSIRGTYLEFAQVERGATSFSMTMDGNNLIYRSQDKKLLVGSTTDELTHALPSVSDLERIYLSFKSSMDLPPFEEGKVKVGFREKAPKRLPYVRRQGRLFFMGGFYKNGFSLSLRMTKNLLPLLDGRA